jgi:hypothetical protein
MVVWRYRVVSGCIPPLSHLLQKVKFRYLDGLGLWWLGEHAAQCLGNIVDCIFSNFDLLDTLAVLAPIVSMGLIIIEAKELI